MNNSAQLHHNSTLGGNLLIYRIGYGAIRLTLAEIAQKYGVKPNQIALAWLLHRAPNILLIPGTTIIAHLEKNIAAAAINLADDEFKALNDL